MLVRCSNGTFSSGGGVLDFPFSDSPIPRYSQHSPCRIWLCCGRAWGYSSFLHWPAAVAVKGRYIHIIHTCILVVLWHVCSVYICIVFLERFGASWSYLIIWGNGYLQADMPQGAWALRISAMSVLIHIVYWIYCHFGSNQYCSMHIRIWFSSSMCLTDGYLTFAYHSTSSLSCSPGCCTLCQIVGSFGSSVDIWRIRPPGCLWHRECVIDCNLKGNKSTYLTIYHTYVGSCLVLLNSCFGYSYLFFWNTVFTYCSILPAW